MLKFFFIPIFLTFVLDCSEATWKQFDPLTILLLRFLRWNQQCSVEGNDSSLLRQDFPEHSTLGSMSYRSFFPTWLVGTGIIPVSVWAPGTTHSNLFGWFFPQLQAIFPTLMCRPIWMNSPGELSTDPWGYLSVSLSPFFFLVLQTLTAFNSPHSQDEGFLSYIIRKAAGKTYTSLWLG